MTSLQDVIADPWVRWCLYILAGIVVVMPSIAIYLKIVEVVDNFRAELSALRETRTRLRELEIEIVMLTDELDCQVAKYDSRISQNEMHVDLIDKALVELDSALLPKNKKSSKK